MTYIFLKKKYFLNFHIIVKHLNPIDMSKGMDSKKEKKKEPTKSIKEKRAEKKAKKAGKGGE